MPVFETPPSSDTDPARFGEPHYEYLRRTGRIPFSKVRDLIEDWVAEVPPAHRQRLISRLRSTENNHFAAAFAELYVHALFQRLGYSLDLEPGTGDHGNLADFLARRDGESELLIEVASISEMSNEMRAANSRMNDVFNVLNRFDCPDYFFDVECQGEERSPIPTRKLKLKLRKFIDALNYERIRDLASHGLENLPKFTFAHEGFRLTMSVIPVSPEKRGLAGHRPIGIMGHGEMQIIDDRTPIKKRIRDKASQHRDVRCPLVLVINTAGRYPEHMDIMEALFGQETVTFRSVSRKAIEHRVPNGALIERAGPRNRNVSAVLFVSSLLPWTVAKTEPVVYHNPWACYSIVPLAEGLLSGYIPDGARMVARPGRPVHEVLGLPEGWPHFEEEK